MEKNKTTALYICTILGAGFATGRELLVYFMKYGIWGFAGIIISSIIFGLTAYKVLTGNYKSIGNITNNKIINITTYLFLIVLYSAMLSASGELFSQIFNFPYITGCISMALLTLITIKGQSIADISLILCPIMILISIITVIYILTKGENNMNYTNINIWFLPSAFIYSAYNIITAIAVLISDGNKKNAATTAIASSLIIGLLATALSLPIYFNFKAVENEPLPLLALLPHKSIVTFSYIFMLLCAIFTTAVSNCYSAVKQINISPLIITLLALLLSFIGFDIIISKVYFLFGIVGLILLFNIFRKI